ncbi:putative quinol monooxygenase [Lactobacillus gallinarum]|uniref:putative quinol monooxygenase n=1 Tax=Lactobacillus gallinarum TaxID=52242 RepID=UPI000B374E93|nr:antibiotic biosynthesis monooxygenase [Lactobacillus gallinarum]OUQ49146.1 antibiotic biosynthesis monooxygenase [Lactobacillus gallinarum]
MSLTVNLYYNGKNGDARKFVQEMEDKGIAGRIRAEEGNEKYDYFIPMDDPETVLLIDSWRDQKALEAHHASSMMKELADLREKYDLHMRVERYISDDSGVPASDQKFIRK